MPTFQHTFEQLEGEYQDLLGSYHEQVELYEKLSEEFDKFKKKTKKAEVSNGLSQRVAVLETLLSEKHPETYAKYHKLMIECGCDMIKYEKLSDESNKPLVKGSSLNEISKVHLQWLNKMGWSVDKKSALEHLALITSEVGEAVNECRGDYPTDSFKCELADIILRTLGLAEKYNINMEEAILEKMEKNEKRGNLGRVK